MAYQIGTNEKPGSGLRRTAREEVACALAKLGSSSQPEEVLHEVRKRLKKLRALLQLVREKPSDQTQKKLAAIFRNASRHIARLRDTQVQSRALQKLGEHCRDSDALDFCRMVQARLALKVSHSNTVRLRRETTLQLKQAAILLQKWPPEEPIWPGLWSAWKQTWQKNFKQMNRALANPDNESLHEWRKRAKTWWYQTRLLKAHSEKKMDRLIRNLEMLTEYLGDDHDLALVEQTLEKTDAGAQAGLLLLLKKSRTRLQMKAAKLGRKLEKA